MRKNTEKGLIKTEKGLLLTTLTSLVLNTLSLGGFFTAMGLDKLTEASFETVMGVTGASVAVGLAGIATAIIAERAEGKFANKCSDNRTPSQKVLQIADDNKHKDEDGESKEFLKSIQTSSENSPYEIGAE